MLVELMPKVTSMSHDDLVAHHQNFLTQQLILYVLFVNEQTATTIKFVIPSFHSIKGWSFIAKRGSKLIDVLIEHVFLKCYILERVLTTSGNYLWCAYQITEAVGAYILTPVPNGRVERLY